MSEIIIREVKSKRDKRKFIYLPAKVHRHDPAWLPPLYMDEWELFDEKKNKSYQYSDTVLYLAVKEGKTVGRIMGIINRRYNEIHNENHGRFCFMECYPDQEVVHALITTVEEWARKKGMSKLVGPLGFSDKDPQGFQIEGFEHPKFIVCPTNDKYLPEMVEREGYIKNRDLVNYVAKTPPDMPIIYKKVLSRVAHVEEYKLIDFRSKRELKPFIIPVLDLMNKTFMEIYGFVPIEDREKEELASRYMLILDPKFIKVVQGSEGLIGFAIGIPDLSDGIRKAKGRLFPFGFIHILRASKKSRKLLMLLGGVQKEYRNKGIDVLMAVKLLEAAIIHKMELIDIHLVLEDNYKMRAECERIGAEIIKRFRIYQKEL